MLVVFLLSCWIFFYNAIAELSYFCVDYQLGAPENPPEQSSLSADDLADQVAEVLDYFG